MFADFLWEVVNFSGLAGLLLLLVHIVVFCLAAAGYVNPFHHFDEDADHRRMTDSVLHFQCRPLVYPFRDKTR